MEDKVYTLKCPDCSKIRKYSSNSAYNLAKQKKSICRSCATFKYAKKKSNLEFLKQDSLDYFYWLGFIFADGHIDSGRVQICLAKKDSKHLKKLSNLIELKIREERGNVCVSFMDKRVVGKIVKRFKIKSNKTENPCLIPNDLPKEYLTALSIGFIDGDGCINKQYGGRKGAIIRVKCHSSWKDNLSKMFGSSYITNQGYAISTISRHSDCKKLKQFAIDNKLPILKRKWDEIDLEWESKYEISEKRKQQTAELLKIGYNITEIARYLKVSCSCISQLIKRNGILKN